MVRYLLASFFITLNFIQFLDSSIASTIAVIDSGVDYKHVKLSPYMWDSSLETQESKSHDEANGFINDMYGWNFVGKNNFVIDYKHLGTFSPDVNTFFEYQYKMVLGTISEEEIAWIKEKSKDESLMAQVELFGSYIHGTHVAGISVDQTNKNKILALKMIASGEEESNTDGQSNEMDELNKDLAYGKSKGLEGEKLVAFLLSELAKRNMARLKKIALYVNSHKADVANGSFGTSLVNAVNVVSQIYPVIVGKEGTPEEIFELAVFYVNENIRYGKSFVDAAPNTLFVFASGNDEDGSGIGNNDIFPNSPCNIASDNVISVAATIAGQALAPFSDWGKNKVDVAAPGVGIVSTIPSVNHDEMFALSGTSQAAPYVTNVASEIKNANLALSPKQIKEILVATVDKKDFLKDKVRSEGMVNKKRAILAAELMKVKSFDESVAEAKDRIKDVKYQTVKGLGIKNLDLLYVLPLQNPFPFSLK